MGAEKLDKRARIWVITLIYSRFGSFFLYLFITYKTNDKKTQKQQSDCHRGIFIQEIGEAT
jgi:hypothetical protein